MSLYVLSDPHLSLSANKPMDIFGERWYNHTDRLRLFWERKIKEDDTIVLPGDISWGMTLDDALPDLIFLSRLPGKKIIGKGNHDYWWTTASKIQKCFSENNISNISLLYNNAYPVEKFAICGSRGWFSDASSPSGVDKKKIVSREVGRLARSLEAGKAMGKEELLAFLHFPPVMNDWTCKEILAVLKEHNVKRCYYGHLHGQYTLPKSFEYNGIEFIITAADHLQFDPLLIE